MEAYVKSPRWQIAAVCKDTWIISEDQGHKVRQVLIKNLIFTLTILSNSYNITNKAEM